MGVTPLGAMVRCLLAAGIALGLAADTTVLQSTIRLIGAEEHLRIDGRLRDFVQIPRVAVREASVAIPLPDDGRISVFASTGRHMFDFGRRGAGPGEFQTGDYGRIGWIGDSVWFADWELQRVTLISPQGRLVRTQPFPGVGALTTRSGKAWHLIRFEPFGLTPQGGFVGMAAFRTPDPDGRDTSRRHFVRVGRGGNIEKRIASVPAGNPSIAIRRGRQSYAPRIPFYPEPRWRFSSDGQRVAIVVPRAARGLENQIQLVVLNTSSGDTVLSRVITFPPERLRSDAVDEAFADWKRALPSDVYDEFYARARNRVPTYLPPVVDAVVGSDGTVWMRRASTEGRVVYRMLNATGSETADVAFPANSVVVGGDRHTVWSIAVDDDDIPSVVRYTVK